MWHQASPGNAERRCTQAAAKSHDEPAVVITDSIGHVVGADRAAWPDVLNQQGGPGVTGSWIDRA